MSRHLRLATSAAAIVAALTAGVFAQAAPPQGRAAAPGTAKPAPPARPRDLTGVWMKREPPGGRNFTGYTYTDPKAAPPALTAWGEERFREAKDSNGGTYTLAETNDPVLTHCFPPGVPRVYFHPYPFEVVHTPKVTLLIYEYDHLLRRVHTDGRGLPEDPDLLWMGTSVGRWENDSTFVVETVGFNEKTWLDRLGHAHSDQLKVTERFRRVNRDRLELEITMEDPKALARPWSTTFFYENRPQWELGEISCSGDYQSFTPYEKSGTPAR